MVRAPRLQSILRSLFQAEYLVYTAEIGADTVLGPRCPNNALSDALTEPPFGLWTLVPDYYVTYR
jgi:hypothetical protein